MDVEKSIPLDGLHDPIDLAATFEKTFRKETDSESMKSSPPKRPTSRSMEVAAVDMSYPLGDPELSYIYVVIEDLLTNVVQRSDYYHLLKVYLGLTESPNLHAIVKMDAKFLSVRDVQAVLFACSGLRLNDFQVAIIMHLTERYSLGASAVTLTHLLSRERVVETIVSAETRHEMPILSLYWLDKYLAHLQRLPKLKIPLAPHLTVASDLLNFAGDSIIKSVGKTIAFDESDTRGEYLKERIKLTENKSHKVPSLLTKVLGGFANPLFDTSSCTCVCDCKNKRILHKYLEKYEVVEPAVMAAEIEHRVKYWVHNVDALGEFQHQLRAAVYSWERTNGFRLTMRRNRSQPEIRLELDAVKAAISTLKLDLRTKKARELWCGERLSQLITRDLMGKFQAFCSQRNYNGKVDWYAWLKMYRSEVDRKLTKFCIDMSERRKRFSNSQIALKKTLCNSEIPSDHGNDQVESLTNSYAVSVTPSDTPDKQWNAEYASTVITVNRYMTQDNLDTICNSSEAIENDITVESPEISDDLDNNQSI